MAADNTPGYGILPPSSSSTEESSNLSFYTSTDQPSSAGMYSSSHDDAAGSIASGPRESGRAVQYLESRGFGWLMEVEEEEEEKPLL